MKSVKFIKSVLIVGSLVLATSALADMPPTISSTGITTGGVSHVSSSSPNVSSKGQLNAFSGVSTLAVSPVELNAVSGEGLGGMGLGPLGWLIKRNVQNPLMIMCKKNKCVQHKA